TFTAADNGGPHTFSITLKTAGTRSITATDTVTSITGSQTGIIVNSAAATTLTVTAPTPASAAVPISVVVTAKDVCTNTATGYLGTVQFTTNDPGSLAAPTLPADYPFVA